MSVCLNALYDVTFINPVRNAIKNFVNFSIMSDLYGLSRGALFEVNVIIPDVSLQTMHDH